MRMVKMRLVCHQSRCERDQINAKSAEALRRKRERGIYYRIAHREHGEGNGKLSTIFSYPSSMFFLHSAVNYATAPLRCNFSKSPGALTCCAGHSGRFAPQK